MWRSFSFPMAGGYSLLKAPLGVYPLFALMGLTIGGVGFWFSHLVQHPEVVWAKRTNPTPYQSVKPNETTKLYDPNGNFVRWSRGSL